MTGFGKAEALCENKKIVAEIRSLNSKQLDLSVKMPALYREAEFEIRNIVNKGVQRGKVELYISVESTEVTTAATIDKRLFRAYLCQLNDALTYSGIDASYDALVPAIVKMPNVLATESVAVSDEERAALLKAVSEAVERLNAFREQEGAVLIADLLGRVERIEKYKNAVTPFEKARTEAIRNRIRENIEKLQVEVDNNRLEQEMIFYIEKLDITEEKVRLQNHCKYFREVAATEESAGRKLGFIAQEMGREINTMGSKANDADMQVLVVKMKDELEKIKEQVLNIL
ncbi:MAG: YicC family protein [Rikenellaceae bacterium]|nr:YicC family protein [Rikenellaceae bacterium]